MDSSQIGRPVWYWPDDTKLGDEVTAAIVTGTHENDIVDLITFPAGNQPLPVTRVPRAGRDARTRGTWEPRPRRKKP
jgi:hypothetical protein